MPLQTLGVLALVAALAVSGCSDDPQPKVAPEPSPSTSSATASPSSSTPASQATDEAAFIDNFVQQVSRAISTGDPSGFLKLADTTCTNCQVIAKNLKSAYADGGRIVDGEWTVLSAEPSPRTDDVWDVRIRTSRERWLDSSGKTVKTVAPSVQTIALSLRVDEDGWLVRELQLR